MKEILSREIYKEVWGFEDEKEIRLAEELLGGLQKLDPSLLQMPHQHPFSQWIVMGRAGLLALVTRYQTAPTKEERFSALDAIANIFLNVDSTPECVTTLKEELAAAKDPEEIALLAKCIAISGDEDFLWEQTKYLADEDPAVVAAAARLVGYGAFEPALKILHALVSPAHFFESEQVIWAIGEIASPESLPVLSWALSQHFQTNSVLIAVGKIGAITSLPVISPFLWQGTLAERECAYQALAAILNNNRDLKDSIKSFAPQLREGILQDLNDQSAVQSATTKFYMLLSLSRLGEQLEISSIRKYLGLSLPAEEVGALASFLSRRGKAV